MGKKLSEYIKGLEDSDVEKLLDNLAYTLSHRRSVFPWVVATPANNLLSLANALDSSDTKPTRSLTGARVGFVFTGQGAQWYAMGRELIGTYPIFKETLKEAEGYLRDFGADWSMVGT